MDVTDLAEVRHEVLVSCLGLEIPVDLAFDEVQGSAVGEVLLPRQLAGHEERETEVPLHLREAVEQCGLIEVGRVHQRGEVDGAREGLRDVQRPEQLVAHQLVDGRHGLLLHAALLGNDVVDGIVGRVENRAAEREHQHDDESPIERRCFQGSVSGGAGPADSLFNCRLF